jgi:hypothetical protein
MVEIIIENNTFPEDNDPYFCYVDDIASHEIADFITALQEGQGEQWKNCYASKKKKK